MLSTRIETSESFGIIPLPKSLADLYDIKTTHRKTVTGTPQYRGLPIYMLSRLSTTPISPYTYLSQCQKTEFAVTPIHTQAEFKFFTTLLESNEFYTQSTSKKAGTSGQIVNFELLARSWNNDVSRRPASVPRHERIFYKLPEQLERHYKTWARYRAEKATMAANSQRFQSLKKMLDDSNRVADLPPPLALPNAGNVPYTMFR